MAIKKDDSGKRWVEMETIVPGTLEQVWQAVATGPGYSGWFTTTEIEERVGGAIYFDFGPNGNSRGEVTLWEPPYRFGYVERQWSPGAPPIETEITLRSRPDEKCLFHMTHAMVTPSDDWDASMEGFEAGWPGFFEVLRLYLSNFAGKKAVPLLVIVPTETLQLDVWKKLTESLGLDAVNAGEQCSTPDQPERLVGVVERVQQSSNERYLLLRLTEPTSAIAMIATYGYGNKTNASVAFYFYGDEAERTAEASREKWTRWLRDLCKSVVHSNTESAGS